MGYAKMTFDDFAANLKVGKYETLTGARRAVGKAAWSQGDKTKANDLAVKHFGDSAPAPKAAKGGAKKAKKAARAAGAAARPRRQPVTAATSNGVASHGVTHAPALALPQNTGMKAAQSSVESLNRQTAASAVITALANRTLSGPEQQTYLCALGDYMSAATPEGRSMMTQTPDGTPKGPGKEQVPVLEPPPEPTEPPDLQTGSSGAPRLEVPDEPAPALSTPAATEQANRFGKAAAALGHLRPPPAGA